MIPQTSGSTDLQIKLFGELCLTANGKPIAGVNSERLQALLALILLHRDTPQPRQQMAVLLWPEVTDAEAKANLRRRLHELKQLIPEADRWLRIEPKTVQWVQNQDCFLDVAAFETAIAPAQPTQLALEQAVKLYQGDLLPSCYDDWIVPYRERLRQQAIVSLESLITLLTREHQLRPAITYAQQLQRLDPLYEPAYCHLMRLHAQEGDRASALRVYHQCMMVLQEELGVNPSPTTCKLYEELLTLEDAPSPPSCTAVVQTRSPIPVTPFPEAAIRPVRSTSNLPLTGREREWAAIQQWMTDCRSRTQTTLLLVLGEPGIGKTRLLEELAHELQAIGGHVLWGRGFEAEMLRPYGAWVDAFQTIGATDFLNELRALILNADLSASFNRGRLFDLATQFMAQLGNSAPVLVVLDDMQWLDETSIAFLHYAARLLSHSVPMLFAGAARRKEIETNRPAFKLIQALHREQRIQTVEVAPLDRQQTVALAQSVSGQSSRGMDYDQIFTSSGGNPLFVLEMVRTQSQADGSSAGTLETLIQGRLTQLDEAARDLLSWSAALGHRFNPTILARVMDWPLPRLLTAIEQLEQYGILRPGSLVDGEVAYDFAHDIVRQVAYQQLSEPRRRLIHTYIAQTLNAIAPPTSHLINDVAHHADLGNDHPLAASASLMAAERCLRVFAYAEASALAQQGIRHCQALEPTSRVSLQLNLLKVYVKAGVPKAQAPSLQQQIQQLIQEAAMLKLKDEEATGLEALIVLNYDHGNLREVQQHSLRAAEQGRTASPSTTLHMLSHTGACLAEIGRDMIRAEALLLEAQSIADRLDLDPIDLPFGLGCVRRYQGQVEAARSLLRQGWLMAQLSQDHWRECTCLMNLVMLELETGYPNLALDYCHELIHVAAQMGEGSEAPHAAALEALTHYLLSPDQEQQDQAAARLEQLRQTLIQMDSPRLLAYVQTIAAQWDLQQGHLLQAITRAEEALEAAQVVDNPSDIALAWSTIIQASHQRGNADCAQRHYRELQARLKDQPLSARAQQVLAVLEQLQTQFSPSEDIR